jgi:hypothetical protein
MSEQVTHDDVNKAFATNAVLMEPDERLLEYLRVLCSTTIRSPEVQLSASNRCITINTILTRRFMERVDRATTRYTRIVIVLAVAGVIAAIAQVAVALCGPHG